MEQENAEACTATSPVSWPLKTPPVRRQAFFFFISVTTLLHCHHPCVDIIKVHKGSFLTALENDETDTDDLIIPC